jgi:UDP-glucuronate decarboxylase
MKILIAGAAGFIGSHLSRLFLNQGHSVIGIDNFLTGKISNLEEFESFKNYDFIEHDVRQPFFAEVDAILNFACPASPKQYQLDPILTIETSFIGTLNLLNLAQKINARFIQASTSEIYGDPRISPQHETYWGNVNPVGIRSCYDEGKRASETLCFDFKRKFDLDVRVMRIFNTYGTHMSIDDGRVISNFIVQALRNLPITIYGSGDQTRSFCYISDLVQATSKILSLSNCLSSPINIGNPTPISIKELAGEIVRLTQSQSDIIYDSLPLDDPTNRNPDIGLAQEILGWQPSVTIQEGILKTATYFKSIL